jgi:Skp family chaperone for outer membrane proteins
MSAKQRRAPRAFNPEGARRAPQPEGARRVLHPQGACRVPPRRVRLTIGHLACAVVTVALAIGPSALRGQGAPRAGAATRIAFVRAEVLHDSAPARARTESRLSAEVRMAETRVRLASDTLRAAVEWFSSRQHEMAPMQREAAMLTLRARELQLEDMVQQLNLTMREKRDALEAPLTVCVQQAMERVRQRDRWSAILDVTALGPVLVLAPEADVTDAVLRAMRELAPGPCGEQ